MNSSGNSTGTNVPSRSLLSRSLVTMTNCTGLVAPSMWCFALMTAALMTVQRCIAHNILFIRRLFYSKDPLLLPACFLHVLWLLLFWKDRPMHSTVHCCFQDCKWWVKSQVEIIHSSDTSGASWWDGLVRDQRRIIYIRRGILIWY